MLFKKQQHLQDIPLPDELADKDSDAKTAIIDL